MSLILILIIWYCSLSPGALSSVGSIVNTMTGHGGRRKSQEMVPLLPQDDQTSPTLHRVSMKQNEIINFNFFAIRCIIKVKIMFKEDQFYECVKR